MPVDLIILFGAISILVLIHELGHFLAARFFGIWVEEFGLGLPPRIFSIKRGNTIYSVNLIPAGGFVKLHGEEEGTLDHSKIKKPKLAFFSKPWWQKVIVLIAGVFMNFILALGIITYLFTRGVPTPTNVAIAQVSQNSPALEAGFEPNDIIISVGGKEIKTIEQVTTAVSEHLESPTEFIITRTTDGVEETLTLSAVPRRNPPEGQGALGIVLSQNFTTLKYPIYTAWYHGLRETLKMSVMLVWAIIGVFRDFITGFTVPKDVAGPIGMYQLYGEARKYGLSAVLELSGLISLNLAIINLFPIPPLDGSRLMFILVERATGKKLKKEWEQNLYKFSFLFLILLFLLISFQDIKRLFG